MAAQITAMLASLPTHDLLWELSNLVLIKEMKVAISETAKSGMLVGALTMASGLVGGPPGILCGGVIGSCVAAYLAQGKFKTVPEIINHDLTSEQKEKLANELRRCLTTQNIYTVCEFALRVQSSEILLESIVHIVRQFITSDLAMKIM